MLRLNLPILISFIGLMAMMLPAARAQGVSDERFARLAKGINISHWFAQVYDPKGYTPEHFETFVTGADFDLIRDLGFTHVRLSVEPKPMMDWANPGDLHADYLAHLDRAIDALLARDLV